MRTGGTRSCPPKRVVEAAEKFAQVERDLRDPAKMELREIRERRLRDCVAGFEEPDCRDATTDGSSR